MLKMALLECANSDNCCSVYPAHPFSSPLVGIWQLKCPCMPPRICHPRKKKSAYAWGGGDWLQLELTDASMLLPLSHDT